MKITKAALAELIQEVYVNEGRNSVRTLLSMQQMEIKNAPEGPLKTYVEWMAELMIQKDMEYTRQINGLKKEIEELKLQKGS